jgi:hypothetical protein
VESLESLKTVENKVKALSICFQKLERQVKQLGVAEQQNLQESIKNLRDSCGELLKLASELIEILNDLEKTFYMQGLQEREGEKIEMGEKKQLFEVRVSPGIFDWCSPEEFREGLEFYLADRWDKIREEIKRERERQRIQE